MEEHRKNMYRLPNSKFDNQTFRDFSQVHDRNGYDLCFDLVHLLLSYAFRWSRTIFFAIIILLCIDLFAGGHIINALLN